MMNEDAAIQENLNLVRYTIKADFGPLPFEREDATQIGSIGLLNAIRTYDASKGSFATYARRCITNELRWALRTERKRSALKTVSLERSITDDDEQSIEDILADNCTDVEMSCIYQDMLDKLKSQTDETTRLVVELRLQHKSYVEIGKQLGMSGPTACKIMRQLRSDIGLGPK